MSVPWRGVDRPFNYYHREEVGKGWWVSSTREEWLDAVLRREASPRPPRWWIAQQLLEGRSDKQSAIIWGRHYPPERKHLIWSQAPDEDFKEFGYL